MTAREEVLVDVGRGIELCYDQTGDPADPPIVLIAGLGQQLHSWPEDFVAALAGRGYRVTRFDNRDVGRSTHMSLPAAEPGGDVPRRQRQAPVPPRRHGPRHRRSARRARLRRCASGRYLDGRDDRPDRRRAPSGPGSHVDVDHVDHRCAPPRPPRIVDLAADVDVASAADAGRGDGPRCEHVLPHRISRLSIRRASRARVRRGRVGPGFQPRGHRPAARGHLRLRGPHAPNSATSTSRPW